MKQWKKRACLLLALMMTCVVSSGFVEALQKEDEETISLAVIQDMNDGAAKIYTHDGHVTFVDGTCTENPVRSMTDAQAVVDGMTTLLGADASTTWMPRRTLSDTRGNLYYVFQQTVDGTTVCGGAVKVITDRAGNMLALSSSVVSALPSLEPVTSILAEEAESLVLQHALSAGQGNLVVFSDFTDKIILPLLLDVDDEEHETESRYVWVVYTNNPSASVSSSSDLPYLAHYVTLDGAYLYNLPTVVPGDTAGATGFDSNYVFEFMEPVDYTGYVDLADGSEQEITVTLMRDRRTGMYYLGNLERKIVVADCYEFLYNHGSVVLESSKDNLEWDQVGLMSLYNYCRAWDFYQSLGWTGGDGQGTPILILNNYCDIDHIQVDNAAFVGNYLGWSIFVASQANQFSQALDVIAHEFTHCVTDATMTYNAYMNDYGAINEAMSDIMGEICELMADGVDETAGLVGENAQAVVRSFVDTHRYQQPEYTWDLYYQPNVSIPTVINDQGGVHTNSSLLNRVARLLSQESGMKLEEARDFWFAVDCTMVPGTDYPQLRDLLPWVMKTQGMEQYLPALTSAIETVRLGDDALPGALQEDRAFLTLKLPNDERFVDGNWMMQVTLVDAQGLIGRIREIVAQISEGDYSSFPTVLQTLFEAEADEEVEVTVEIQETEDEEGKDFLSRLIEFLIEPEVEEAQETQETETPDDLDLSQLQDWLLSELRKYVYRATGSAGQDAQTIRMICRPGRALPILIHMSFAENSETPEQVAFVVYLHDHWYDLTGMVQTEEMDFSRILENEAMQTMFSDFLSSIHQVRSLSDVADLFFLNVPGGTITELSAGGLENVVFLDEAGSMFAMEETEPVPARMSRPKLPDEETEK